jgi:transcriptional regulator with XRE-family HTH domain
MRDRIEKIIESEGLTSSRFAEILGIQRSSVSHFLNGRNNPSLEVVLKILGSFPNLSSEWLLFGTGQMYKSELSGNNMQTDMFTNVNTFVNSISTPNNTTDEPNVTEVIKILTETKDEVEETNVTNQPIIVSNKSISEKTEFEQAELFKASDSQISADEVVPQVVEKQSEESSQNSKDAQPIIKQKNPEAEVRIQTPTERIIILNSDRTFTEYFPSK